MSKEVGRMAQEAYAKVEALADECDHDLTHSKKFWTKIRMIM